MRLYLNFLLPSGRVVFGDKPVDLEMTGFNYWIDSLIQQAPSTIFFFTTISTDIDI